MWTTHHLEMCGLRMQTEIRTPILNTMNGSFLSASDALSHAEIDTRSPESGARALFSGIRRNSGYYDECLAQLGR